jgi:hypothetical protein
MHQGAGAFGGQHMELQGQRTNTPEAPVAAVANNPHFTIK